VADITSMTPQELLARIRRDREALAALWSGLDEGQMVRRPGPQEDWSVKDLIAHITWWESYLLERVMELVGGAGFKPYEDVDALNARAYQQHKDTPLDEVLAAFEASWPRWEALISSLTTEQISTPAYYRTSRGVALLPILAAGTFNHYPDHTPDLRAYVERLTTAGTGIE
jgi:hypothetical protein